MPRPAGHHGRHRLSAVASVPAEHAHWARLGSDLTPTELAVLADYAHHGSIDAVAECRGISSWTVKTHLVAVRARTGAQTTREVLALLGWLRVPAELAQHAA